MSCKNFLNAQNVKAEIEETIAIANSTPITYYVSADKDSGTVTPAQIRGRQKETFDIMFTPSDEWKFIGWEVLDRDTQEPVENALTFSDATKLETKVTISSPKENLIIHAKCVLLPAVESIFPPNTPGGYEQDTTVKITFNKPVDPESFGDFSCISITNEEKSVKEYYGTPYFSEDNKELYFPAINGKFIIPLNSEEEYTDIILSINFSGIKDVDGLSIAPVEDYTYRINKRRDTLPPEIKTLRIAKTKEDAENGTNLITFEQFANYATGTGAPASIKNHHVRTVWIYVEATDKGTGVSNFTVKEKYLRGTDGAEASVQPTFQTSYNNETGEKNYTNIFEHTFKCPSDGVVELSFSASDYAEKKS